MFAHTFKVFLLSGRGGLGKHGDVPRRVSIYQMCSYPLTDCTNSQNMVLFQTAYPMIICLIYCILAGNTAFVRVQFLFSDFTDWPFLANFVSLLRLRLQICSPSGRLL